MSVCVYMSALKPKWLELSMSAVGHDIIYHGRPTACIDPEVRKLKMLRWVIGVDLHVNTAAHFSAYRHGLIFTGVIGSNCYTVF